MARKRCEDDDGRTIADMSDVSGGGPFLPRRSGKPTEKPRPNAGREQPDSPYQSRGERWMAALGALKAALLIGFAYLGGLVLVVILLLVLWKFI